MLILRTFFIDLITFVKTFALYSGLFELILKPLSFFTENIHQTPE